MLTQAGTHSCPLLAHLPQCTLQHTQNSHTHTHQASIFTTQLSLHSYLRQCFQIFNTFASISLQPLHLANAKKIFAFCYWYPGLKKKKKKKDEFAFSSYFLTTYYSQDLISLPYLPPIKSVRVQGQQRERMPGGTCGRPLQIPAQPPSLSLTALV